MKPKRIQTTKPIELSPELTIEPETVFKVERWSGLTPYVTVPNQGWKMPLLESEWNPLKIKGKKKRK